ncbi:MAG TPA: tail fiber domain-containing protein [Bacteroidia bacterium]|nr:tail fiber domain-containing protein [Bacteroidia bacterium]
MKKTNNLQSYLFTGIIMLAAAASSSAQSWLITGNAGTSSSTNFIGTTDNKAFKIRTNNINRITVNPSGKVGIATSSPLFRLDVRSGSINTDSVYRINGYTVLATPGTGNLAVGKAALQLNTNRFEILAVGDSALYNNGIGASFSDEAVNNTAVGAKALKNNTKGGSCTAVGYHALYTSTEGFYNTAVGANALSKNTTGGINVAIGSRSLQNNTTGGGNTAVGESTLFSNTTGNNNVAMGHGTLQNNIDGSFNTAVGDFCMPINSSGFNNTAIGLYSMYHNISGSENTGVGQSTLYQITTGTENVAVGSYALNDITNAIQNTAVGVNSLRKNNGSLNTAVGYDALNDNTGAGNCAFGTFALDTNLTGQENLAVGRSSLFNNTIGSNNTAAGNFALVTNTTGGSNIGIGYFANVSVGNLTNAIVIGANATVNASNKMQLGASTTTLATTGGITIVSDGRFKNNVKDEVPGLDFIRQLHPVAYNFDYKKFDDFLNKDIKEKHTDESYQSLLLEKSKMREVGFIAQEVNNTVLENKYAFNGVYTPQNDNDNYAIDYARFVVPLVKAVQEIDAKTSEIEKLKNEIEAIKNVLTPEQRLKLNNTASEKGVSLYQNNPNPFTEKTTIEYYIPETITSAVIKIYSLAGVELKSVTISAKGIGFLEIKAGELSAGTYTYMLIADGKTVDTKQMVLTK